MTQRLIPDLVLTEAGWTSGRAVTLEGGRIASIERVDRPSSGDVTLAGKALVPGTVNAHCHTFQSLLRGLGDDLDFTGWRDRVLYPFSERLDGESRSAPPSRSPRCCWGAPPPAWISSTSRTRATRMPKQ